MKNSVIQKLGKVSMVLRHNRLPNLFTPSCPLQQPSKPSHPRGIGATVWCVASNRLPIFCVVWLASASRAVEPNPKLSDSSDNRYVAEDEQPTDDVGNVESDRESLIMNERPQRIRALNLMLAIRSPREDDTFKVAPDMRMAPEDRLPADRTWFELNELDGSGFARVVTMRAEVETPNLYRGQP